MVFLGKIDPQDSYLLYNGTHLVLARSVRRINTCWKGHLAFYFNFNCASYEYRSSFGGRVVPTKSSRAPIAPGFNPPVGDVELSKFFDEDAEAVRQKALEEQREDYKQPTWPSTTSRTLCRRWSSSRRLDLKMQVWYSIPIQLAFSMMQWKEEMNILFRKPSVGASWSCYSSFFLRSANDSSSHWQQQAQLMCL